MVVHWRKVWRDFGKRASRPRRAGPVAWSRQKRKIQALVERHSGGRTGCPAMRRVVS